MKQRSSVRNAAAEQRSRAIAFVLASAGLFTVAAALVKVAAPEIPTVELMLFRSLVALVILLPWIIRAGGWRVLQTRRPGAHLMRACAGLCGMFGTFYGLAYLPIAVVTALGFAMPLFLAVLSVPMLGERMTAPRAVSVAAGLLGVLLVIRPWNQVTGLPLFETGVVITGVAAWALAMISIRRMGQSGERNITIVTLFSLACTVITAVLSAPVWVMPRAGLWLVLIGVGAVSGLAQVFMTEGYRSGEASMLAPFEYSAILYTLAMGWLIWGEVPGPAEAAGMAVLVASGLHTWWRETR